MMKMLSSEVSLEITREVKSTIHVEVIHMIQNRWKPVWIPAGQVHTDAIFMMRQLQEKYGAKKRKLYHVFVDLEQWFSTFFTPFPPSWILNIRVAPLYFTLKSHPAKKVKKRINKMLMKRTPLLYYKVYSHNCLILIDLCDMLNLHFFSIQISNII